MKKFLAILGLLLAVSQPVFAQYAPYVPYNSYAPRVQVLTTPMVNPSMTGAACPVAINPCNPCNPCLTGAADPMVISNPCNPCNVCPERKGFWSRFFGY